MSYGELLMWHIVYGEANGGEWDWERNCWIERSNE